VSWVVQLALPRRTRKAWTRRSLHSPPALRMSSSGEPEMIARPLPALWLLEVPVFASTWRTGSEPRSAAQTKAGLPAPAGLAPAPHQFRDSGGRAAEQGEASRSSPLAIQSSPFRWPGRGAPAERPMRSCGRRAWRATDRAIASAPGGAARALQFVALRSPIATLDDDPTLIEARVLGRLWAAARRRGSPRAA
jgi:hypothetical protein